MKKLLILFTLAVSGSAIAQPGFRHAQPQQAPVMPTVVYAHQQPQVVQPPVAQLQQPMYQVPMQPVPAPMPAQAYYPQPQVAQPQVALPQQPMVQYAPVEQAPAEQAPAPMVQYLPQKQATTTATSQAGEEMTKEDMTKLFDAALRHRRANPNLSEGKKTDPDTVKKIAEQENDYQYTVERTREIFLRLRSLMQRTLETVNESLRSLNDMIL